MNHASLFDWWQHLLLLPVILLSCYCFGKFPKMPLYYLLKSHSTLELIYYFFHPWTKIVCQKVVCPHKMRGATLKIWRAGHMGWFGGLSFPQIPLYYLLKSHFILEFIFLIFALELKYRAKRRPSKFSHVAGTWTLYGGILWWQATF